MKYNLFLFTVFFLWSCSSEELSIESPVDPDAPVSIQLEGILDGIDVNSRAFITGTKPSSALALNIFRADATSGTIYNTTYTSKLDATMETTGAITWGTQQYYLTDPSKSTKLIGLYPSGGTYASANRTVTYATLNGTTDVMCSNLAQGSRDVGMSEGLTFAHLLTRVNVSVKAANTAAITAWGNVTGITLTDKNTGCIVTLPTPASGTATIASSGTATDLALTTAAGAAPGSKALTTAYDIYGYALFLPVTGALSLNITTANGATQTKTLASQAFAAGTAYNIQINFTVTGIIANASITDWTTSGTTITGDL